MTLSDLGNLGEFLASLGVLVSLIYVGIQIRQNTTEAQRTNARATSVHHSAALHALSKDNEIADIFVGGIKDIGSLTDAERYRFDVSLAVWLQAIEKAFLDHRAKRYTDDELQGYRIAVPNALNTPGGNVWWRERQLWFSSAFREEVEALLRNPPEGGNPYVPQSPSNKALNSDA
ncbi:MAG: hypothetical protein ACU84Q_16105 [Gammaproteobacteria bacterium]